jgi:hypothetical protein
MVKWEQTEKMLNAFFPKKYGMTYLQMIWYEENIPPRGWDLEKILSLKLWEGKQS